MKDRYFAALDFPAYLKSVQKNKELWRSMYERVKLDPRLVEKAREIPGTRHLLDRVIDAIEEQTGEQLWGKGFSGKSLFRIK